MTERSLLRERDFRLLAGSVGVSALGDWLAAVALILMIEEMTDSGIAVSALLICLWTPSVVLAGHVGLLVDRVETTRLLAFVSLGQAAAATALAFTGSLVPVLARSCRPRSRPTSSSSRTCSTSATSATARRSASGRSR
jgi:hypothetical protein